MLQIQSPFQQLFDTNGSPLDDGYVYIGTANANPETSPIAIYWDDAGTIPAAQPLRTLNGYIVRSGTPARVYTSQEDYSLTVKNRNGVIVLTVLDATSDSNLTTALAASSGSSLIGFLQAGTGAIARTVQSKLRDTVSVKDFGAVGDGVADDTAAIQAAVNTGNLVLLPKGIYRTTAPIVFDQNTSGLIGENYTYSAPNGSVIDYTGPDEAIKVYGSGGVRQVTGLTMERFGIAVRSASAKGLNFRDASYSRFKDIWIRLYASNSTGVYGIGNQQVSLVNSAPYYNVFDNVQVFGQTDGVTTVGQRGYWFVGDGVGADADGPNANTITNIGRMAGLEVGFDIYSGNGNLFSNIGLEAIRSYCFKIGNGTGAPGRADGNMGTNIRVEGLPSCVFAKFEAQATNNIFTNYSATSLDSVVFENNAGYANLCKPKGIFYVANFYGKNIPANTTTKLDPEYTNNEGGIVVPIDSVPYSMHVTVNRFAGGGAGSGVVNFYRGGLVHPTLAFTVDNANRFGGRIIQNAPDVAFTYNRFDGVNGFAQVDITTTASWNQTTADVQVQIVFLG